MHWDPHDTIVALASAVGGGARGIVRLSGVESVAIAASCFQPSGNQMPLEAIESAQRVEGAVAAQRSPGGPPLLVPACALVWPTARSFTRQPIVEFHALGSPPLLQAIADQLTRRGARPAQPGEFTLRAFLAGRIDLPQAEAVLGVVDAQSDSELSTSLVQLAGGLSKPLHELRQQLLGVLAELEAGLDFVEEDIELIGRRQLEQGLAAAQATVDAALEQLTSRDDATHRPCIVLVGTSNAGKSSLFNRLVKLLGRSDVQSQPAALVSPNAGTTRDYVSASVDLGGRPVELIDTAGAMETQPSSIEASAQAAALEQSGRATLRLRCVDATKADSAFNSSGGSNASHGADFAALTKSDLLSPQQCQRFASVDNGSLVSSKTGEGLPALVGRLAHLLEERSAEAATCVAATAVRCADSLRGTGHAIARAQSLLQKDFGDELIAAELRFALTGLGEVVGAVYTDDVLDRIFSQFCIGK